MAITAPTATATVASLRPKRSAAQMNAGNTIGWRLVRRQRDHTQPGHGGEHQAHSPALRPGGHSDGRGCAHARTSGTTTNPPATPPSHQLRRRRPSRAIR